MRTSMACLLLALLTTAAHADSATAPMTAPDDQAIRDAIDRHWNIPVKEAGACRKVLKFRISLDPDGTVKKTELLEPVLGDDLDPCRAVASSAVRATLMASPLPAKGYPTIVLRFDPYHLLQ